MLCCPACSSENSRQFGSSFTLQECESCGAVFGECYLGESYRIASPGLHQQTEAMEIRYFDLTCLGSNGIVRRHGWSDRFTGKTVQFG